MILDGVFYAPQAYDLKTGRPVAPLAGGRQFSAGMSMLCSTLSGCPGFAMARRSSLGFVDLAGQSGSYQYPVIRSGCWINMIPAGGVVTVPEGGSSCQCAYNYKTSAALMSDDRNFHFGIGGQGLPGKPALRINFGAPGDRPDAGGQVWFAWPRPAAHGRSLGAQPYGVRPAGPRLPIEELDKTRTFRTSGRNPDWLGIEGTTMPWLQSFGLAGPVRLAFKPPRGFAEARDLRVTLYFCELEDPAPERAFDVRLQGKAVLTGFAPGPPRRGIEKSFTIPGADRIILELIPRPGGAAPPVISGILVEAGQ
jgi:hypothetical protein